MKRMIFFWRYDKLIGQIILSSYQEQKYYIDKWLDHTKGQCCWIEKIWTV